MNLDQETLSLSRQIWNYHQLNHSLQKADCIIVLGSHDTRVAERGAQLYLQGYAPLILFTGGLGRLTEDIWTEPEADKFARIARDMGVPGSSILIENKATNTGENISLSYDLLKKKGIELKNMILVQKPYMERRAYASFMKQWPEEGTEFIVTSPKISFEDYPNQEITRGEVINIMMGDLQRIREYPNQGFQIPQDIPQNVWEAFEKLKERGFTSHLV